MNVPEGFVTAIAFSGKPPINLLLESFIPPGPLSASDSLKKRRSIIRNRFYVVEITESSPINMQKKHLEFDRR